MFDRLVVATDLSPASDAVVGCLHGLQAVGARQVVLVHALGIKHLESLKYPMMEWAEPRLARQAASLREQGFATETVMPTGAAAVEVNQIADKENASLIVVGSHGATATEEILLGGTALAILHHARRPVLIARLSIIHGPDGQRCEAACVDYLRHILYPTDFSDGSEAALERVSHLVKAGARRVTLCHVQDRAKLHGHLEHRLEEFNHIDRQRLERIKAELEAQGATDIRIEIPYGSPVQEIQRLIGTDDVSWVIMGSQGRGFIAEVFLGSVGHHVARRSPVPVLLVPAARRE